MARTPKPPKNESQQDRLHREHGVAPQRINPASLVVVPQKRRP